MAQTNAEQYREEMGPPSGDVHYSASAAGNGKNTAEEQQGGNGEQRQHIPGLKHRILSEPPSSCVGYGGGDDRYHETPNLPTQGYWEESQGGENAEQWSQYGHDRRETGSGTPTEKPQQQQEEGSRYGTVDPNAKPHESGFGSSGPGGYPEDGSNVGSYGAASSQSSAISTDESEVRGGVPHRVTSDGVASGAGLSDGVGRSPTPADIEQHQYHLGEVTPSSQKGSPYSQQLTQPDESTRDHFQEDEGISGNTKGGTAADHQKEAASAKDGEQGEGFLKKLMRKLSGHSYQHEVTDDASDIKHVDSGAVLEGDEGDKPGVITALKEKVVQTHDKHHDEINPEIYE